jgi:hypothetical protein
LNSDERHPAKETPAGGPPDPAQGADGAEKQGKTFRREKCVCRPSACRMIRRHMGGGFCPVHVAEMFIPVYAIWDLSILSIFIKLLLP